MQSIEGRQASRRSKERRRPGADGCKATPILVGALLALFLVVPVPAQTVVIDSSFDSEDPCTSGWTCQGAATWISPDAPACLEAPEDPACNPFDPPTGFARLTPDEGGKLGALYFEDRLSWESFTLTVEFELTGGGGGPADGMAIVIVGSEAIPGPGHDGGGLGAAGLGDVPTMIFEIDNYSNGDPDRGDGNHLAFEYSPTGFASSDQLPSNAFAPVSVPLNGSGRFLLEARFQDDTVTCDLTNDAAGLVMTQMFEYTLPDFEPFEGFLGVTASTGGQSQSHIVHSVRVETLASVVCLKAPATVDRDLRTPSGEFVEDRLTFQSGDEVQVGVVVSSVRPDAPPCTKPAGITIREVPPAGWVPFDISEGGSYDPGSGAITWEIPSASLVAGKQVSYAVSAVEGASDTFLFAGTLAESGSPAKSEIRGESALSPGSLGSPFDPCGGIRLWNILGAYSRTGGADPGEEVMRLDYMSDGTTADVDFPWAPGATIRTRFGGQAPSQGVVGGTAGRNPRGIPTVFGWGDADGRIDTADLFKSDLNDVMLYAQTYVFNDTGADLEVKIGVSSDDAVQVLLNGSEVWINNAARPGSDACSPQDISPDGVRFTAPIVLLEGENSLIVKVFEGGGGWEFAFRFQDAGGAPITEGLRISLEPGGGVVPVQPRFHRGDSNSDGQINITDGIYILNFLFLGGPGPSCEEAANPNDDAAINITDGIFVLNFLFLGGPAPAAPGPTDQPCGPDPAGSSSDLGCQTYAGC